MLKRLTKKTEYVWNVTLSCWWAMQEGKDFMPPGYNSVTPPSNENLIAVGNKFNGEHGHTYQRYVLKES